MHAPVDVTNIRIETERLLLRPVLESDLEDIHEIVSMKEVAEMSGWQYSQNLEMSQKRLREYIDDNETLAVVLKDSGKVIGTISMQKRYWNMYPIDRSLKGRELGFDLHKDYWGRGLMPEAVRAVTDYCFEQLHYDFLTAGHFLRNRQSARAIEKCGFSFLFEADHALPTGVTERIRTYIRYNPQKEI